MLFLPYYSGGKFVFAGWLRYMLLGVGFVCLFSLRIVRSNFVSGLVIVDLVYSFTNVYSSVKLANVWCRI